VHNDDQRDPTGGECVSVGFDGRRW